jgi:hypothetical protein
MEDIEHTDLLFKIYIQKLSTYTVASIMHSTQVQNNLAGGIGRPFMLADAMLAIEDQDAMSVATTPSFNWKSASHHNALQTVPHEDPEAMDLSVTWQRTIDIRYGCHGNGHHTYDCLTANPNRGPV